ncbi:Glycosyltransferase involved in cell wall bisynthesis [Paenibacillus sp. UNCCL117]|uniref:glycosyltransferase family 4 protein n=1 Tax=unclassified Paenibacillus TaxID=185978 RepID=UPI000884A196|nr:MULTISPECIES: glycosyltransferase family 4 protein [unclassified Paenibacillus]SDD30992.1 Glycosyltransferase involved in cell wall bisynthesis [Paenibacillus sp. cl123]SFW40222.1 Glycosyltransferase involved in cell wall bisynthesis [Paenibacillus sp. UNCCL117]
MKRRWDAVVVTPGTFPIPSGTSSSVELVTAEVARRLHGRVKLAVFGRRGKRQRSRELCGGVCYRRVPAPSPRSYIRSVSRRLRSFRPRVIQVENRPRFARVLKRRHPGAKVWLSLHSVTFVSRPHMGRRELRRCLRAVDRVIVNSRYLCEELIRRVPEIADRITVNHLGVDKERFISRWTPEGAVRRQAFAAQQGLEGRKIILYVGRLIPIKGVHHLLAAMPDIIRRVPEATLVVVGSAFYGSKRTTPYVRRLRRMAAKLQPHVRFVPYVPHHQVDEWFRLGDVLAVPSARHEAFGLVNVEAMAAGVPVVATRAGGMPEIVLDGITGYTVDPAAIVPELSDRIAALLLDEERARCYGESSAQRVAECFTWDCTAGRWLELFISER